MKTWQSQMNPFNTVMRSQVFIVSMWRLKTLLDMTKLHFTSRSQVSKIFRNNFETSEFKGCCIKIWNIVISIIYNTVRLICFYWIITQNQAHVKSAQRKVGCYQILMEVVHIYHTIYAVLSQDRLNTFFFCTTLNLSFFSILIPLSLQLLFKMSIWRWSQLLAEIKK